jgi:hypothetical protein
MSRSCCSIADFNNNADYLLSLGQQRRDDVVAENGAQQQRRDIVAALHDQLKQLAGSLPASLLS